MAANLGTVSNINTNFTLSLKNLQGFTIEKGFDYIENQGVASRRCKEQGFRFFSASYVHKIQIEETVGDFSVRALCWRSQRKNESAHKLIVTFQPTNGIEEIKVIHAHCSCQAGINAGCSHIPALFYCLSTLITNQYAFIPEDLSCTSLPQQWGVPRGNRIKPIAAMNNVFGTNSLTKRKKGPQHCSLFEARVGKAKFVDQREVGLFEETLKVEEGIAPLSYLLTPACATTNTCFGPVQRHSPLSYQLTDFKMFSMTTPTHCCFSSLPLVDNINLTCEPISSSFYEENVSVTINECRQIVIDTVKQAQCPLWKERRSLRLCSSNFGLIAKRKKITLPFLKNIFQRKDIGHIPSVKYGRDTEAKAKREYLQQNSNLHLHSVGLVINPNFPFLASSPDGVLCTKSGLVLLEVKCPHKLRNLSVKEAVGKDKFYLIYDNENIVLNEKDNYYFQVQGQMMTTGILKCKFLVYSNIDFVWVDVPYNREFCRNLLLKLKKIYVDECLPFLAGINQV